MSSKQELRAVVRDNLDSVIEGVNNALRGKGLRGIEPVLKRLGRGGVLPHWYEKLKRDGTLPNLDGKTIGSVVEMILVAILETRTFSGMGLPSLRINPARGVDLPDLDLGVKSPSENYCTSEPFFSGYERLLGGEHDAVVLLTDYQDAKKKPPLRLQITRYEYLTKSQIADENLCRLAKGQREWLLAQSESWAKKVLRFLAFVNQSDWRAKKLVRLISSLQDSEQIKAIIAGAESEFATKNAQKAKKDKPLIPESDLMALKNVLKVSPLHMGVIDAADNWVIEVQKDFGRFPNDNEWGRFLESPLDGRIGMSYALQWRYNFAKVFGADEEEDSEE
jgi:hypothetical protein